MSRKTTHLWAEIQAWLDALNWKPSQAKLAERLELKSRSVITDWKYGNTRPTPEHLARLAHEMELVSGPKTYERLVLAVIADLGYNIGPMDDGDAVRIVRIPDPDSGDMYVLGQAKPGFEEHLLSEPADTDSDLIAADEQEQSISGEQVEPETP